MVAWYHPTTLGTRNDRSPPRIPSSKGKLTFAYCAANYLPTGHKAEPKQYITVWRVDRDGAVQRLSQTGSLPKTTPEKVTFQRTFTPWDVLP